MSDDYRDLFKVRSLYILEDLLGRKGNFNFCVPCRQLVVLMVQGHAIKICLSLKCVQIGLYSLARIVMDD